MANEEHVALLRQGVARWNEWRKQNFLVAPNFRKANITEANLPWANLRGADLTRADLTEANLSRANLSRANLGWANLTGANLDSAHLYETVFVNTNLGDARGLDHCRHEGPSTIDHRTLTISGPLPLPFLRGCGLPDQLIDYLPSLLNQAIQFYSCFLSYSTEDQVFANGFMPTCKTRGSAAGLRRTTFRAARRFTNRLTKRFASTTD